MTTRVFSVTGKVAPPEPPVGSAPSWFTSLPLLTWTPVAAGATTTQVQGSTLAAWQKGATLKSVVSPPPYQDNKNQADIVVSGNGAAVNQLARELYFVCCGGHSARQENDSFRIVYAAEMPYAQRIADSTPFVDLDWHFDHTDEVAEPFQNEYWGRQQWIAPSPTIAASGTRTWNTPTPGVTVQITDYPACAGDGAVSSGSTTRQQWKPWTITTLNDIDDRPRTSHTGYTPWYVNGRVWFPIQNSVDEGSGPAHNIILSFDVTTVLAGTLPRPFVPGRDVWDYWRQVPENGTVGNLFGAACLDPSTGKVWYHPANETHFYAVHTNAANEGDYTNYNDPNAADNVFGNAASAICPVAGRRLWVVLAVGDNHANGLRIFNLESIEAIGANASNCQVITNVPSIASKPWNFNHNKPGDQKKGWGAVWFEPDLSFLLYSCDDMTSDGATRSRNLRRLKPPLNPNGSYNASGTWVCDEVAIAGLLPDIVTALGTPSVSGCSFTRFNIFNDMGNGQAMLVSQGDYATPSYVCRLPLGPLSGS